MLLVYASRTNNIKRFVNRLTKIGNKMLINSKSIQHVSEPFWLITYTDKFGEVPDCVVAFLKINYHYLRAVSASGNRNFGLNFAKAADVISHQYRVPVVLKFELSGTITESEKFEKKFFAAIENNSNN